MRVTTDLFVSALVRRAFSQGGFAAVMRKGAGEAGAVFILCRARDGRLRLFGPAPQTSYESDRPRERRFAALAPGEDEAAIEARLQRELRFDPDAWIVELEIAGAPEEMLDLTTP